MFTAEGTYKVKITEAVIADAKFADAPAFDVCLKVQSIDDPTQEDWWRGEVSANYGQGNMASKTQAEMTFHTLEKLGFKGGQDVSRIGELVGTETVAGVKASKDGKYYNVRYLGASDWAPESLPADQVKNRMAAIMGMIQGGGSAPASAPASAAPAGTPTGTAPTNPFANTQASVAPAAPAANPLVGSTPGNPF